MFDHGDLVEDQDDDSANTAVVVNTPDATIDEWNISSGTVADQNPTYRPKDDVIVVVYKDELDQHYPLYTGVKPLKLAQLSKQDIPMYAFPSERLEQVGDLGAVEIDLDRISPAPYHSRNFSADSNQGFIDRTRSRGGPHRPPLVRVTESGEIFVLDGHKRVWASHVAGLDSIPCWTLYIDREQAARTWANRHLEGYSGAQLSTAIQRLRSNLGDQTASDIAATVGVTDGGENDGA